MRFRPLVLIYGAGEMGSAVAHRLFRAKFRVVISAKDDPLTLLRGNAFSTAVLGGSFEVEGVPARRAVVTEALSLIDREVVPILTAESRSVLDVLNPDIVVDARSLPPKARASVGDASLVIGIGRAFTAGTDCDLAISTERGHNMGRILYRGKTPTPAAPSEEGQDRILISAKGSGTFKPLKRLGQRVEEDEPFAELGSETIRADRGGALRGMLREGTEVPAGAVLAEVDSLADENDCFTISGLGRAVSGGVLEVAASWVADVGAFPYPPPSS